MTTPSVRIRVPVVSSIYCRSQLGVANDEALTPRKNGVKSFFALPVDPFIVAVPGEIANDRRKQGDDNRQ
jgi:hypothetical protein